MKKISFKKYSGAGNDFVLFDQRTNDGILLSTEDIRKLCDRHFGIGADGLLLISESENADFNMKYFNADGNEGSLCGNGSRCALQYHFNHFGQESERAVFYNKGDIYSGEKRSDHQVSFFLKPPGKMKFNFKVKAFGQMLNCSFVDTGSPHCIINARDILRDPRNNFSSYSTVNNLPVLELGKEIRYLKDFAPDGVNVNFIDIRNDKIFIRTYERGVENETLACGTGSTAAAILAFKNYGLKPPVEIVTVRNLSMKIDFMYKDDVFSDVSLTGPAEEIFSGNIIL